VGKQASHVANADDLLQTLEQRFAENMRRHQGVEWSAVREKLLAQPSSLNSVAAMEASGGEPDAVLFGDTLVICDCAPESPAGRRSLCFDDAALQARKEHKPEGSAMGMAQEMGIELLDEHQYQLLQQVGEFDLKTSSWLRTPEDVRNLGGGLFGDRRFGRVFIYHNGVQSYYAARGFRGYLKL
jgi:hypothetical protein